ncbi:hypothetical protein GGI04_004845 [Coemansia thaxteri]|uniref:Uncharacterized protein n=1 Tax=Coemansia thaxteri TaxID=2663907 RepID=A0A9W8BJH4_9FUNG|nr:hypothetical protein GGI04_004845 [Coemansia thaxteri]KAJ2004247.1 hypothetical protein H4R26_002626 [Coemansia thaxteri]KAJ2472405.1 hypothetical protein GGI02_001607 [Coemansia sp. RSA 2322]KAJ2477217.1 hypothetical protein EV174_004688 [Coemansia sp. RSA 2320]
MNATAARSNLHHTTVRGKRIEVHFDTKIPPQFCPRFDDASADEISPTSPNHPPPLQRGASDESRHFEGNGYKSQQPYDKPDYNDNHPSDRRPGARNGYESQQQRQFGNGAGHRPPPRGSRAEEGTYQEERRWNGPAAYEDRRPAGPMRTRTFSDARGPPRPYERNGRAHPRGGFRERGHRGRVQGGDIRGHASHGNLRSTYVDMDSADLGNHNHRQDKQSPPQMRARYSDECANNDEEEWQGDDLKRSPRRYSSSRSPSQRRTRSISPGRNSHELEGRVGQWSHSPSPANDKHSAPSSASPRDTKPGSSGAGRNSYYDEEFSLDPEVQPRAYSS